MYTMENYLAMKRNEIVPFTETWMDLEIVTQGEERQKQKNKCHIIVFKCEIQKMVQMDLFAKQKQNHRCREQTYACQEESQDELRDWEKEYIKAAYCHPAYLNYMQSTS